ncbi:MAG: hypothetical protein UU16_C0057G0003 [Candidatus Woesebacteria bacterium GW2011_GWA2_40_7]|uniref:Uncharacterized protein n=3 Tax=Candidatus Woeseibacteriota TaxID=1752722 RepID=A0A0G0X6N8_9BACT|nr:MAG: hypothetical protein UT17_C0001G0144 [Candidatus Woesebacteria bacterium GW2011_GWB1_39_10]KKR71637.1 MAG: hypothetical protein UU16_C0057G0003 [Candidatus Woesebacteria bacterium GW2011_GWA2_40_7]KKR92330.1 MAG: hypothetical protein UU42_C0002G0144 [Candidatus Woesebacteria bacterium GW2011_GWA1_41_13b]
MTEREARISILTSTKQEIESLGTSFENWFGDQVALVEAMSKGQIFQKVGDEYLKLSINDFLPYVESRGKIREGEKYGIFVVPRSEVEHILRENDDIKKWALRVINLGMMTPNMNLYFWDGEEYSKLEYTSDI